MLLIGIGHLVGSHEVMAVLESVVVVDLQAGTVVEDRGEKLVLLLQEHQGGLDADAFELRYGTRSAALWRAVFARYSETVAALERLVAAGGPGALDRCFDQTTVPASHVAVLSGPAGVEELHLLIESEEEAERWLEAVAPIAPWLGFDEVAWRGAPASMMRRREPRWTIRERDGDGVFTGSDEEVADWYLNHGGRGYEIRPRPTVGHWGLMVRGPEAAGFEHGVLAVEADSAEDARRKVLRYVFREVLAAGHDDRYEIESL